MSLTIRLRIEGRVQGVGYRAWLQREALRNNLAGWVRNRSDGSVEALLHGESAAVEAVIAACARGPRMAVVERVERLVAEEAGITGFRQLPTE